MALIALEVIVISRFKDFQLIKWNILVVDDILHYWTVLIVWVHYKTSICHLIIHVFFSYFGAKSLWKLMKLDPHIMLIMFLSLVGFVWNRYETYCYFWLQIFMTSDRKSRASVKFHLEIFFNEISQNVMINH